MKLLPLLLLITVTAYAVDGPVPDQFAQGYRLETDGKFAIYQLPLPEDVYRSVTRRDLGDIRVFNTADELVPHAVRRTEQQRTEETVKRSVPFFPLSTDQENISDIMKITTDANGRITNIVLHGGGEITESREIGYYLIDLSAIKQGIDELQFELTGNENNYVKSALLQRSSDLTNWYHVDTDATLANMQYGEHHLVKEKIRLPGDKYKYLRFRWRGKGDDIRIKSIDAILTRVAYQQERQWSQVEGKVNENDKAVIEFDTTGFYPVDRVELEFPEDNTLIEAVLRSRNDENDGWQHRYSGLFYKLMDGDTYLKSGPVDIRNTTDRYWQLTVSTDGGMGTDTPVLHYSWVPDQLYFLARGRGPFTLAFGNAGIEPPRRPVGTLLNVLNEDYSDSILGTAAISTSVSLKGEQALAPELEIPWQRILLWTVLVCGVVITGVMAVRLFRQMNDQT